MRDTEAVKACLGYITTSNAFLKSEDAALGSAEQTFALFPVKQM